MSANVATGFVTVNSEKVSRHTTYRSRGSPQLAEARRNALSARDQMLKTRKRMNDALISAKRAEAAREEVIDWTAHTIKHCIICHVEVEHLRHTDDTNDVLCRLTEYVSGETYLWWCTSSGIRRRLCVALVGC